MYINNIGNVTIAETITLASRLHSSYYADNYEFLAENIWYQPYVDYAILNGIITANQFSNYTSTATRIQFAMVFAKALPEDALTKIKEITLDMKISPLSIQCT